MKSAVDYWKAESTGQAANASAIKAKATPAGKALIDVEEKTLRAMWDLAESIGYKVKDPVTGQWKPFKKGSGSVFPRMIKQDVMDTFRNYDVNGSAYKKLRDQLINDGAISQTNADQEMLALKDKIMGMLSNDLLGNVDLMRTAKLPDALMEYGFDAIRRFTNNFSEAMARKIALGQKTGGMGSDIFDHFHDLAENQETKDYIKGAQRNAYNDHIVDPVGRLAALVGSTSTFLQLANWLSVMRNLITGVTFSAQHFGMIRTANAILDAFKGINDAYERGIIREDIMNIMQDGETMMKPGLGQRLASFGFKWSGWNAVEVFNRGVSYQAAKGWLRYAIAQNKINPISKESLIARGRMQRLGINANNLLAENGSGPLTDRFFRSAVNEIQGGYQYDQTPGFTNTPMGQFWLRYRKFGTQALMHFDREVVRPFARAVSSGRWSKETVTVRDPVTGAKTQHEVPGEALKLVSFLLLMSAAGMGEEWLRKHIFGMPGRSASLAEIFSRMSRDKSDAITQLLQKMFGYATSVGGFGLLGDVAQMPVDLVGGRQIKSPLDFPSLAPVMDTFGFAAGILESKGEQPLRQVDEALKKIWGFYRTTGQVVAQGVNAYGGKNAYFESISRKQDLSWLRGVTRRFNDEMEVKKKPGMPAGRRPLTPETPFRDQLKDYLRIGDTKAARKLVDDHFKGISPEDREDEMKKLQRSIQGSQPIYAGDGGGESARVIFLDWARTALTPAEQARLLNVDKTYRQAANILGLMSLKPPKPKDLERTRVKLYSHEEEEE